MRQTNIGPGPLFLESGLGSGMFGGSQLSSGDRVGLCLGVVVLHLDGDKAMQLSCRL